MSVECNITKDDADFYVEAYTDDVVKYEPIRVRLAYVAGYRNYDQDEGDQLRVWLDIKKNLTEIYRSYEDGYVTVKLVIKEGLINP